MTDVRTLHVPISVRLHFGRAAAQKLADQLGVELLHLKGDAFDALGEAAARSGTDVDVLLRPDDVSTMHRALIDYGWSLYSTFQNGSPFGHAQTYHHDEWGYLDLHRRFPGIGLDAREAFDHLWRSRTTKEFCGVACAVPARSAQAVIIVLNAARASGSRSTDVDRVWHSASDGERAAALREVAALQADVGFDAGLGDIERHRGAREYRLWRAVGGRGSRAAEWWGRILAEPNIRGKLRVVAQLPRVNREHLAHRLGRRPTRGDVVAEFFTRPMRGVRELLSHTPQ